MSLKKICTRCEKEKYIDEFYLRRSDYKYSNGRLSRCKECIKAIQKERRNADKETFRWRQIYRYHGITKEAYNVLLNSQGGVCAICQKKCKHRGMLCVDHDHKTNKIRGLLCVKCNAGLGQFDDSRTLLFSAINYLENTV